MKAPQVSALAFAIQFAWDTTRKQGPTAGSLPPHIGLTARRERSRWTSARLQEKIEGAERNLRGLERNALLAADHLERQQFRGETRSLKKRQLFDFRKQWDALNRGEESVETRAKASTRERIQQSLNGMGTADKQVFISSCHADQKWRNRLRHIREPLEREEQIAIWEPDSVLRSSPW